MIIFGWGVLRLCWGVAGAGIRTARSRAGENPRHGSENSTTVAALQEARNLRREYEETLAVLEYFERLWGAMELVNSPTEEAQTDNESWHRSSIADFLKAFHLLNEEMKSVHLLKEEKKSVLKNLKAKLRG